MSGVEIGLALAVAGTATSAVGGAIQYDAGKKAEKTRKQQMRLEADRARRDQIRRAQVAKATATAGAVEQGAKGSSALAGGLAQISGTAGRNVLALNQDEELGNKIFKANAQSAFGGMVGSIGQGMQSLGGAISSNSGTIKKMGQQGDIPFIRKKKEEGYLFG